MSSSTLMVRLVPLTGRNPYDTRRSVVVLEGSTDCDDGTPGSSTSTSSSRSITIGRGPLTGITDPSIPCQVFRLFFDEAQQVWASRCDVASPSTSSSTTTTSQDNNMAYINGLPWEDDQPTVQLTHGDVVSLRRSRYAYKVEIIPTLSLVRCDETKKRKISSLDDTLLHGQETTLSSNSTTSHATISDAINMATTTNTATTGITIPKEMVSSLSDDIQCSVCLDIQVHPRTLYPCGHSFCGTCLATLRQCPQCRETVTSHVPAVQLENLIATLVGIPNLLEPNDVEHYHQRKLSLAAAAAAAAPRNKKVRSTSALHTTDGNTWWCCTTVQLPDTLVGTWYTHSMMMSIRSHALVFVLVSHTITTRSSPRQAVSCRG
jgi:Zinc finger, C3HC4 type (RING finger)